jgi:hypothetical protein
MLSNNGGRQVGLIGFNATRFAPTKAMHKLVQFLSLHLGLEYIRQAPLRYTLEPGANGV